MKAWRVHRLSQDLSGLSFDDVDLPEPEPDQVRLRLRATSLNFPDLLMTRGEYQLKPDLPFIPGMEGAGEVVSVGADVSHVAVGDRVVAGLRLGGFAEQVNAPASGVRKLPDTLSFAQGAAYPVAYLTAYVGLVCRGHLQAGETLLVHGAAGGVGLAAVDLGRHLGATVIATASTREKLDFLKNYGADHVLDSTRGFREQVKELTAGAGADVIYDPVGGDVFDESTRCIAWNGRILIIGFSAGRIPAISVNMPLIKGYSIVGVRAGEYGRRDPRKGAENIAQIDSLASQGKLHPHICAQYPLPRALDALASMRDRRVIGKIILTMND